MANMTTTFKMFNHLMRAAAVRMHSACEKATNVGYFQWGEKKMGMANRETTNASNIIPYSNLESDLGVALVANTIAKPKPAKVETHKMAGRTKIQKPLMVVIASIEEHIS